MAGTVICDYINSANVSGGFLGIGQTWQDVTASRALGTTYTNSTGKPIEVWVQSGNYSNTFTVTAGGIQLCNYNGTYESLHSSFIIPNGSTYSVSASAGLTKWVELR